MMESVIYPQAVEESIDGWVRLLSDPEFLQETRVRDCYIYPAVRKVFGPPLFESWMKDSDASIETEKIDSYVNQFVTAASLLSLKEKGLVDSIQNENGVEVFWLTKTGKDCAQLLINA
jgi:hypothetical protein